MSLSTQQRAADIPQSKPHSHPNTLHSSRPIEVVKRKNMTLAIFVASFVRTTRRSTVKCSVNSRKAKDGAEPLPEGLFYLMLIGELPTTEDVNHITNVWQRRSHVPSHVFSAIDSLPLYAHPMTMFVTGVMALQTEGQFATEYASAKNSATSCVTCPSWAARSRA